LAPECTSKRVFSLPARLQRPDAHDSAHHGWLPYISKESLFARIESLEAQLQSTQQALPAGLNSHEASIQRTGITTLKHVHGSHDVADALSIVSGSLDSQDTVAVAPAATEKSTSRLEDMPEGSTVFVTFVNGDEKYREMMINWALHLRAIEVWHVVVAFDAKAAATCAEHDIPFIRHVHLLLHLMQHT
jgi:hypothetical protein